MLARAVVYLRTACPERGRRAHLPVPKNPAAKPCVSITSKLIEKKELQVLYFGHLQKTGGRGSYQLVHTTLVKGRVPHPCGVGLCKGGSWVVRVGGTSKQLPQSWRSTLLRCPSKRGFATGRCASPRPESCSDQHTLSKACRLLLELRNPRQISPQPWKVYPMNFSGIYRMDENSLRRNFGGRRRGKEKLMRETATYPLPARRRMTAPLRQLIWIQEPHFLGWGCSECAWVFTPSGPPIGNSLEEMKENYLRRRDEESAAHVCAEHPKAKKARVQTIDVSPRRQVA
jgi:hypothetical protein